MTTDAPAAADRSSCPICGASAVLQFRHPVVGRISAAYYKCSECRFVFARPAHWLADAYSSALAITDTGAVARNIAVAEFLSTFALFAGLGTSRGLDVGGGHGLLVRMLRDRGLDFRWTDEHAENLYARGFGDDSRAVDWITLVEVFEHLVNPGPYISELVQQRNPRCIFFTTELRPEAVPPLDWPYWSFETGQHVGFACAKSLDVLASRLGYSVVSRSSYHLLYRDRRLRLAFVLAGTRLRVLHALVARRFGMSHTLADHRALVNELRERAQRSNRTVTRQPTRRT